jgi:hypothetical protein
MKLTPGVSGRCLLGEGSRSGLVQTLEDTGSSIKRILVIEITE